MLSFIGDYTCKADNKYRVVVPASFRKVMAERQQSTFILRKNIFENCLDLYSREEWEVLTDKARKVLTPFDRKQAVFFREWYRGAQEIEMDANGRILLPKKWLEAVKVEKEMVLSGQETKIEIWNPEVYAETALDGEEFARLTQEIFRETENKK